MGNLVSEKIFSSQNAQPFEIISYVFRQDATLSVGNSTQLWINGNGLVLGRLILAFAGTVISLEGECILSQRSPFSESVQDIR